MKLERNIKMEKKRDAVKLSMAQEALEGTQADSIQVPLEVEYGICAEELGVKGRTVCGLGAFPRLDKSSSSFSTATFGPSFDGWMGMQNMMKQLVDDLKTLQNENFELRSELQAFKGSQMCNSSSGSIYEQLTSSHTPQQSKDGINDGQLADSSCEDEDKI